MLKQGLNIRRFNAAGPLRDNSAILLRISSLSADPSETETRVLGSPTPRYEGETGGERNLVIFEDKPYQYKGLVKSSPLIWLFLGISLKTYKSRFSHVLLT